MPESQPEKSFVRIEGDLHRLLKEEAARRRRSLEGLIDEALRTGARIKRFIPAEQEKEKEPVQ